MKIVEIQPNNDIVLGSVSFNKQRNPMARVTVEDCLKKDIPD